MNALHWLGLTTLFTATLWIPYVLERIARLGLWPTMDNPRPDTVPPRPWAQRARAAHANAVENLVLFAAAVLAAAGLGLADDAIVLLSCQIYLLARLLHAVVYTAGVPVLRTLTFAAGVSATATIAASAVLA